MSTKIYNAYKLSNTNLNEILNENIKQRHLFEQHCKTIIEKHFDPYYYKLHYGQNLQRSKQFPDSSLDFSFSALYFPHGKDVYCILYSVYREYQELFEQIFDATDFHFQNQFDIPDNVDPDEYQQREEIWDILIGDDPPYKRGFLYEFVYDKLPYPHRIWTNEEMIEHEKAAKQIHKKENQLNIQETAEKLLKEINAPVGSVSIWTGPENILSVKVDEKYIGRVKIPEEFNGFKVEVGKKEKIVAL